MSSGSSHQRPGATAAQVKADINAGATGDKVAGFDPAASPLGTDDEAGGTRLDPLVLERARLDERRGRPESARTNAASPDLAPDGRATGPTPWLLPSLIGALAAVILAVVAFLLLQT